MNELPEPHGDLRGWLWWHWLFDPSSGDEVMDYWYPLERRWAKHGGASGFNYVRPATMMEVESRLMQGYE